MARNTAICLVFITLICFGYGQDFIVNTTMGLVRGYQAVDGDYINYLGIPYGKVREDSPFGASIPHPPFDEIFEAVDDSAICPQEEEFNRTIVGTLDCLHLNVHVPSSAGPNNPIPVFVWIYGGGFQIGFYGRFLYGPKFLTRHNIIVVSLNYRIGPYGFMSLDTPEVPGNQGLKDQVMALRWIRDNIAAFGGDPNKITIAGNSAGSKSVDFHVLRECNESPIFHQIIQQSGSYFPLQPASANHRAPLLMAEHLGFATDDVEEAVTFLAKQDPLVIIDVALKTDTMSTFTVVVEKEFSGVESFLTENWHTNSEIPAAKDLPVLIGFNNDEALLFGDRLDADPMTITLIMASFFDYSHPDFEYIVEFVQNFYFDGKDDESGLIDFIGDIMFMYPMHRSIERFLKSEAKNIYLYEFSYSGERNFVKHRENFTLGGAIHADEIGYLFDISYMDEPNVEDQVVVDSMTTMWANFVKYGDPTPETSALLPHKWQSISNRSPYHYLNIDLDLSVGTRPLQDRMAFWDLLYDGFGHLELAVMTGELNRLLRRLHF